MANLQGFGADSPTLEATWELLTTVCWQPTGHEDGSLSNLGRDWRMTVRYGWGCRNSLGGEALLARQPSLPCCDLVAFDALLHDTLASASPSMTIS